MSISMFCNLYNYTGWSVSEENCLRQLWTEKYKQLYFDSKTKSGAVMSEIEKNLKEKNFDRRSNAIYAKLVRLELIPREENNGIKNKIGGSGKGWTEKENNSLRDVWYHKYSIQYKNGIKTRQEIACEIQKECGINRSETAISTRIFSVHGLNLFAKKNCNVKKNKDESRFKRHDEKYSNCNDSGSGKSDACGSNINVNGKVDNYNNYSNDSNCSNYGNLNCNYDSDYGCDFDDCEPAKKRRRLLSSMNSR